MKFGVSKKLITPLWSVFMGGYAGRKTRSEGIHDDLFVKTVLINDGNKSVLIISCDAIFFRRSWVDEIKEEIKEKYGVEKDEIIIQTTHSHSAAQIVDEDQDNLSPERRYMEFLREKIMQCVSDSIKYQCEGTMEYGQGISHIGINRRLKTPEGIVLGSNPGGPVDRNLSVIQIKNKQGQPMVIMFNVACHATVLGEKNMLISADFPGVACKDIEARYAGCTAVFIQGACGDINPLVCSLGGRYFKTRFDSDFSDVEIAGKNLAHDVSYVCKHMKPVPELKIGSLIKNIKLQYDIKGKPYLGKVLKKYEEIDKKWHSRCAGKVEGIINALESGDYETGCYFYVQLIELVPGFRIVGLEGEIFTEIALKIRELFSEQFTIIAGYANGCVGYVPARAALEEGGYEVDKAFIASGRPGPLSGDVENLIVETVEKLSKNQEVSELVQR